MDMSITTWPSVIDERNSSIQHMYCSLSMQPRGNRALEQLHLRRPDAAIAFSLQARYVADVLSDVSTPRSIAWTTY